MGSLRSFAYGQNKGFYGEELATQSDGNGQLRQCFLEQGRSGPVQAPLPFAGRTTHSETFSSKKVWKPRLPQTVASVASHMHPAVCRGKDPVRGAIIWDQPERLRPESLIGMADKNKSKGSFFMGAPSEKYTHYELTFKGLRKDLQFAAVEPPVPAPKNEIPPPDKRLFSSYETSTGQDFGAYGAIATFLPKSVKTDNPPPKKEVRIKTDEPAQQQMEVMEEKLMEEQRSQVIEIPSVKTSHTHGAFKGHNVTAVEPPVPAPQCQIPLPDKRLFTSYETSAGRDFGPSSVKGSMLEKGIKTYIDDSSRVMGAQIPNRVRNILFTRHSQSTETIQTLPSMVDIMPHSDLVRQFTSAHPRGKNGRPSTAQRNGRPAATQSGPGKRPGSRPSTAPSGGRSRSTAGSGNVFGGLEKPLVQEGPERPSERVLSRPASAPCGGRRKLPDRGNAPLGGPKDTYVLATNGMEQINALSNSEGEI